MTDLNESFQKMVAESQIGQPPRIKTLEGKELFFRFIEEETKAREREDALYQAGLDAYTFSEHYQKMIDCVMYLAFTPAQVDTIEWWLYEDVEKIISYPKENREIRLDTPEQLWDYIQANR